MQFVKLDGPKKLHYPKHPQNSVQSILSTQTRS